MHGFGDRFINRFGAVAELLGIKNHETHAYALSWKKSLFKDLPNNMVITRISSQHLSRILHRVGFEHGT